MWYAHLLLRLGRHDEARDRTVANLAICERFGWLADVARCRWVLGRLDTLGGDHDRAADHLAAAERTFRAGRTLVELPPILLAQADLARRRRDWAEAARRVDEALALAAPRGMRLHHADALVLRGRIALDQERPAHAVDDAEHAKAIAEDCGYAWAERDAVALLADAHTALGNTTLARRLHRDAESLHRRLQTS